MTIRTLCVVAVGWAILSGACPPARADAIWPIFILDGRSVRLSSIEVEQVLRLACTRETDRMREFRGATRYRDDPRIYAYARCHEEGGPYGMPLVSEVRCTRTSGVWACGSRGPGYHKVQVGSAFALLNLHPMDRLSDELAADPQEAREVIATLLGTRRFKGQAVSRAINGSRCGIERLHIKPNDGVWYVRCEDYGYHLRATCTDDVCSYELFRRHDEDGNFYQ